MCAAATGVNGPPSQWTHSSRARAACHLSSFQFGQYNVVLGSRSQQTATANADLMFARCPILVNRYPACPAARMRF